MKVGLIMLFVWNIILTYAIKNQLDVNEDLIEMIESQDEQIERIMKKVSPHIFNENKEK